MGTKFKSNISNMKRKRTFKTSYERTILIKPADKGGEVTILLKGNQRNMIMQHLSDENTYKKQTLASTAKYKVTY